MLEHAGSGHSAGPLGMTDIFTALYFNVLKHDPKKPEWEDRDILLLSNGHTVPVRYATMARAGYFDVKELQTLRQFGSRLQGHPERTRLPGMETTSGPLGSGLSQGAGMAYVLHNIDLNPKRWVYVMMGDGELNEGNIWEAAMFAGKNKLHNLIGIIDRNNIQIDGNTEDIMPLEDLRGKWESFGWHVQEIDGNNIESVIDACSMARAITNKPSVIIAHTVPGKGVDFMEYDYHWHGAPPNSEQAKDALKKLRTLAGKIRSEHE
jgi:transketolase